MSDNLQYHPTGVIFTWIDEDTYDEYEFTWGAGWCELASLEQNGRHVLLRGKEKLPHAEVAYVQKAAARVSTYRDRLLGEDR